MDNKTIDSVDFVKKQQHEKALVIGRRYLNIFHQLHFIEAGMEVLNKDFLTIPDVVVDVLPEIAGGVKFKQHIQNLKDGKTPIDKIDASVLPFGELVFDSPEIANEYTNFDKQKQYNNSKYIKPRTLASYFGNDFVEVEIKNTNTLNEVKSVKGENVEVKESADYESLFKLLKGFKATPDALESFKMSEEVRDLGPDWKNEINNILATSNIKDIEILKKNFGVLCTFDTALNYWKEANLIIKDSNFKSKGEIEENIDTYQKYLSMFGAKGKDLFSKIKALVS